MTIEELRSQLLELADKGFDQEEDHIDADKLLLKYIADKETTALFHKIRKWYA